MSGKVLISHIRGYIILFLFSFVFALFLAFPPTFAEAATEIRNDCVANACGTSEGTRRVPVYGEVCEEECPTIRFQRARLICPPGYPNESHSHEGYCRNQGRDWPEDYRAMITEYYGSVYNVLYDKSNDPHKCHRPSDSDLDDDYGMNHDTRNEFKRLHEEWIRLDCHDEIIGYETVACSDATIIPCEEECPTECGYLGGTVADGQGGLKECPATNSCSTYRWCFPEEESPTGFLAQALSISIPTPTEGKPWESGVMIDRYCAYVAEGTCPTECGYAGGEVVPDGDGGTKICPATQACPAEGDGDDEDGDVLGDDDTNLPEDEEEVKGTSTVVLANTGAGSEVLVYLVQGILVLSTITMSVFFTKKYII